MKVLSYEPSVQLIEQHVVIPEEAKVLLFGAESPQLVRQLMERALVVDVFDFSHTSIMRVRTPGLPNVHYHETAFPSASDHYDIALMLIPKGRGLARAWLWTAYHALKPGGEILIAGPNDGGIKSAISDAAVVFGHSRTIAYKQSHRIGGASKQKSSGTPFPAQWGDDPTQMQRRQFDTPLGPLRVMTMPGIFSWNQLDDGTQFLLGQADLLDYANDARVLDVGCGCGIIGTLLAPYASQVILVDDSWLAVQCSKETIKIGGHDNVQVLPSDVYGAMDGETFDLIVSNPPFHRKFDKTIDITARIIQGAPQHLNSGGRLMLVCNSFLPYHKLMAGFFKSVRVLADNGRFKVLVGW